MNNYRKILFKHLDGIVCIPTILALQKIEIIEFILTKKIFSINDILSEKKVNPGYLSISLRTLRSLNIIDFKPQNSELNHKYIIKNNFNVIFNEIKKINNIQKLLINHNKFIYLSDDELSDYLDTILEINLSELKNQNPESLYNYFEGIIIGPLLANLSFYKNISLDLKNKIVTINIKDKFKEKIYKIFKNRAYLASNNKLSIKGEYFLSKTSSYGVTVSYLNTLNNIDKMLTIEPDYIWKRTVDNHEIHINRSMNVWGSGGAHKTYFKKIDKIIIRIFNQDINKQPQGIIDVGCGDGSFLKHVYEVIMTKTIRKKYIKKYPLTLIGTDINKKARESSRETLKDIKSYIIEGNISNPSKINKTIKELYGLDLENFVNCRTFLDHNRIFQKTEKFIQHDISSTGNFCFKGEIISSYDLISNFILHMLSWKQYIKKFGLIIIELHTLKPEITKNNLGNTLACAYDATHGYSDQYLIEYEVFKKCINYLGMKITKENEYLFPKEIPTVSINYIK